MQTKKYVKYFIMINALLVLFVLIGNILIDPQGYLNFTRINKINKYVVKNNDLGRLVNSIQLKEQKFDIIFMGTSRVQSGMNVNTDVYKNKKIYNASLGDSSITEMILELEYILEHQTSLKELVLGLSFHVFSSNRNIHPDYYDSLFVKENEYLPTMTNYFISYTAIADSITSIQSNINGRPQKYWENGFYNTKNNVDNRKRIEFILNHYLSKKSLFGCFKYDVKRIQLLEDVLNKIVNKGIKVSLFISPQHAKSMLMIDKLNLFNEYFQWMKDINHMVNHLKARNRHNVKLWNFSGFNSVTNEVIPYDKSNMKYFFESSHYTPVVGNLILSKMKNDKQDVDDFGHEVTDKNIDKIISEMKTGLKIYKMDNKIEVSDFDRIFTYSQNKRDTLGCYK